MDGWTRGLSSRKSKLPAAPERLIHKQTREGLRQGRWQRGGRTSWARDAQLAHVFRLLHVSRHTAVLQSSYASTLHGDLTRERRAKESERRVDGGVLSAGGGRPRALRESSSGARAFDIMDPCVSGHHGDRSKLNKLPLSLHASRRRKTAQPRMPASYQSKIQGVCPAPPCRMPRGLATKIVSDPTGPLVPIPGAARNLEEGGRSGPRGKCAPGGGWKQLRPRSTTKER